MSIADKRRYRSRATGIVFRVEAEHCGVVTLASMRNDQRAVVADAEIADAYTRCDIIDAYAPTCGKCGGEKFSIPGQRANLGWLCGHCAPRVVASHDPADYGIGTHAPDREWRRIGAGLRGVREQLGATMGDLADALGITVGAVSDREMGRVEWTPSMLREHLGAMLSAANSVNVSNAQQENS
jgi:hypothetical protein